MLNESFVGIDVSKDWLDVGWEPAQQAERLAHDEVAMVAAFARAIRPQVRAPKDDETLELGALLARCRQLIDMRVQEKLRLERASPVQRDSIKEHITWLTERIARLDTDLTHRLRSSSLWRDQEDLLKAIPGGRHHNPGDADCVVAGAGQAQSPRWLCCLTLRFSGRPRSGPSAATDC
jgi:transposase